MISFSTFGPALVTSGKPNYRLGMGRKLTVVSAISLSLLLALALLFGRCGRYGVCRGYRAVSRHRKLSSLVPPSPPRKQRPQLKDVERILLVVQYPVVNDNVTMLLNSHPNLAIAYNTQLLDKAAGVFYHNESQVPQSQTVVMDEKLFIDGVVDQLRHLSTQAEKKCVKVIGDNTGFTLQDLNNSKFQKTFQSHLKMILNRFHLPVSVLFVTTVPLGRKQQAMLKTNNVMLARTTNVSILTVNLQHLSPDLFMERVCDFLWLSCSLDHADWAAVSW